MQTQQPQIKPNLTHSYRATFNTIVSVLTMGLYCYGTCAYAVVISDMTPLPYECNNCDQLPHETLNANWPVKRTVLEHETLHQQQSKKYTIRTTLRALNQGIPITTQAAGAILRISQHPDMTNADAGVQKPLQGESTSQREPFNPTFYIQSSAAKPILLKEAATILDNDNQTWEENFATGSPNNDDHPSNQQTIVQLKSNVGAGRLMLMADPAPGHDDEAIQISIFDKNAAEELTLTTDKASYWAEHVGKASLSFGDANHHYPLTHIQAKLISAQGDKLPVVFKSVGNNRYTTTFSLPKSNNSQGSNWDLVTTAKAMVGDQEITREVHSAVSLAIPSAVIREIKQSPLKPFTFIATIEVATGSRYELQGVLFNNTAKEADSEPQKTPLSISQISSWLTPGTHEITFSFPANHTKKHAGPFYLGELQLLDFAQVKPVFEYKEFIDVDSKANDAETEVD